MTKSGGAHPAPTHAPVKKTSTRGRGAAAKKKAAAKDKRGAIFALKRKKMYENEIEKLQVCLHSEYLILIH